MANAVGVSRTDSVDGVHRVNRLGSRHLLQSVMKRVVTEGVIEGFICRIGTASEHLIKCNHNHEEEVVLQVLNDWTKIVRPSVQFLPKIFFGPISDEFNDADEAIGVAFLVDRPGIEECRSFIANDEVSIG
ncbi:hypothetical protein [Bradyrhizobium embrapense]|uniref:hypothetical protein n=1 Tax=Bradyrhizobium embrapense TaxID=630921 RepID=UPI0012F50DA3|nr:hypothetical protein [Bradyrhizobium embrapense]